MSTSKLEFRTYVASRVHGGMRQVQHEALDRAWRQIVKSDHQVLTVLGLTLIVLTFPTSVPKVASVRSWTSLNVAVGTVGHFVLGDGRTADLNTGSEAHVLTTPSATYVVLNHGEVFLDGHGAAPIHVVSNGVALIAKDATFSVRRRDARRTDVLVGHGAVELGRVDGFVDAPRQPPLAAGQSVSFLDESISGRQSVNPDVVAHKFAWKEGWLWFSDETLADAVERFNSYNLHQQLVVSDPRLANITIGGRFRPTETASFVSTVQRVFGLKATTVRTGPGNAQTVYFAADCAAKMLRCDTPLGQ